MALLLLIGRLQDLNSSCSKLFEILLFLLSYTDYLFQKQEHLKNLARSKLFYLPYLIRGTAGSYSFTFKFKNYQMKGKLVHTGAPLVLLFLIGGLEDLTSSSSKLFAILLFLISYWTIKASQNLLEEIKGNFAF